MSSRQRPPFDWDQFDFDQDWVGRYAQKAIKQFFSNSTNPQIKELLPNSLMNINYNLFETHRSIFVRIRLPNKTSPKAVKLSVNSRRLKISLNGKSEVVLLPHDVDADQCTATFKDGILELRLPKSEDGDPYRRVQVFD